MGHADRLDKHSHKHRRGRDSDRAAKTSPRPDLQQQLPLISPDALFTIDRRGDSQNVTYGSIDRYKVPKYRTAGYGSLLGLDRRFKIVSKTETKREVDNEALDSSSRPVKLSSLLRQQDLQSPSLLKRDQPSVHDCFVVQRDYIKLGNKREKVPCEERSERDLVSYGQLEEGEPESEPSSDSDVEPADETSGDGRQQLDDADAFAAFKNHPDNQKYVQLRRQTEQNPNDVTAWLDLIDHQERHFALSAGIENDQLSAAQRRTVTDMKVSMYEKAVTVTKDGTDREKLVIGMMKEGAKIWDTNKQLIQWNSVLTSTTSLRLWYDYLNFCQSNVIVFSYEKCLDVHLEILRKVAKLDGVDHDYNCAYVALRLTTLMLDAGFSERSIAIWQALLEYNLFTTSAEAANLQALKRFWESEVPRVGEEGAKGWQNTVSDDVPSRADRPLPQLDKRTLFSEWRRAEISRSVEDIMPARTLDDTVEDDPFRVILFTDVEDFVFRVKSPHGREFLKQAFTKFCDLPPLQEALAKCRGWWTDPFLCRFTCTSRFDHLTDTSTLFAPPETFLRLWDEHIVKRNPLLVFATLALTQVAELYKDATQLAEYVIALRLVQEPSSARKFARTLLKRSPNSLRLYNAFALIEARTDKLDSATKVWSTALSMASSFDVVTQSQRFILWHSWMWTLLQNQRYSQVLAMLVDVVPSDTTTLERLETVTSNTPAEFTSDQRLRADTFFREQISNALNSSLAFSAETIPELTDLYATLKYFSHDQDLSEAVTAYQSTLAQLAIHMDRRPELSIIEERVYTFLCHMFDFHAQISSTGYRPTTLLSILETSLSKFPHNSMFVSLREKYLRRAGVADRLRMRESHHQDANEDRDWGDDGLDLIQSLQTEMTRDEIQGRTTYSVRRAFEGVVTTETDSKNMWRSCPGVWQEYLRFEASNASRAGSDTIKVGSARVKDVWLAGLRACPWYKASYLGGLMVDGLVLGNEKELEKIYRSMSERGLRVRIDLEEILDERDEESEG